MFVWPLHAATLINSPDKTQYLISANHCLGQNAGATMWGLLFDYNNNCRKDGQPSLQSSDVTYGLLQVRFSPRCWLPERASQLVPTCAAAAHASMEALDNTPQSLQPQLRFDAMLGLRLQGLEIVWNDEVSDVMLMRLDDEIPTGAQRAVPSSGTTTKTRLCTCSAV